MPGAIAVLCAAGLATAALVAGEYEGEHWVREGAGTKQGPLLMGDDLAAELQSFCAGVEPVQGDVSEVLAVLDAAEAPAEARWRLPAPPPVDEESSWVFVPPLAQGCRNATEGTGHGSVAAGEHRGEFMMQVHAEGAEHRWAMASPCVTFTPPRDGRVRCRMAVVVHGVATAEASAAGETTAGLRPWIAHCHPKEHGRYSMRTGWDSAGMPGTVRFDRYVMLHEATFPVRGGVEHLFGAGLSAGCAARSGAVGVKLWGRLAYVTVEMLDQ
ncbi:MAG: hypothetical protein ACP5KN_18515 [Armatimonadota bacterium]